MSKPGPVSEPANGVSRVLGPLHRCCSCHLRVRLAKEATYAHTGTEVAFIIAELPGERAEALFIAMAAQVPTAGEQSEI